MWHPLFVVVCNFAFCSMYNLSFIHIFNSLLTVRLCRFCENMLQLSKVLTWMAWYREFYLKWVYTYLVGCIVYKQSRIDNHDTGHTSLLHKGHVIIDNTADIPTLNRLDISYMLQDVRYSRPMAFLNILGKRWNSIFFLVVRYKLYMSNCHINCVYC